LRVSFGLSWPSFIRFRSEHEKATEQNPKGVSADEREVDKQVNDRDNREHKRGHKSKVHFHSQSLTQFLDVQPANTTTTGKHLITGTAVWTTIESESRRVCCKDSSHAAQICAVRGGGPAEEPPSSKSSAIAGAVADIFSVAAALPRPVLDLALPLLLLRSSHRWCLLR
jgi:hypothetical protein